MKVGQGGGDNLRVKLTKQDVASQTYLDWS